MTQEFIPHEYQKEARATLRDASFFGLFLFPGAGKTVLTLDKLYSHKEPALVIAPLSILLTTWLTEHQKWDFSSTLKIALLHGPDRDKAFNQKAGIYLVNPEGIPWLVKKVSATRRFPWKILVIDESAKFKSHRTKRFEYLQKIIGSFKKRFILSGNPTPNHYLDLWAQIYILDQGKRLGPSWYAFREEYFYPEDYKRFNWLLKPDAKEKLISKLSDICMFLDPSDELSLPKRVVIDHDITLSQQSMAHYRKMQQQLFAEIDENKITVKNATISAIKCWQIYHGFLYEKIEPTPEELAENPAAKPTRKTHFIHNELIPYAEALVEELQGSPILIVYTFNEDLVRLKEAFPDAKFITPDTTAEQLQKAVSSWNQNKIEILVTQISKLSHGVNLQFGVGHQILFYGLTYNADTYDQLIRRFERQGANYKEVIIHRLKVKNTLCEALLSSLESKQEAALAFLTALKEYRNQQRQD